MNRIKLGAVLVTGLMSLAAAPTPGCAASRITDTFLNNLNPNIDFLDRSSRLALTQAGNARLRAFAGVEAKQQTLAANSVDEWIRANRAADNVLAAMSAADDGAVQTGRSVAIDAPAIAAPAIQGPVSAPASAVRLPDTRQPMGQADLDRLGGLTGAGFDAQYKLSQLEALRQIEADYVIYIVKGDDPMLLGIANRELPQIERRIAELRKR